MAIEHIQQGTLNGFHLVLQDRRYAGVVIPTGAEGSPHYQRALRLAQEGYEVMALFF